MLADILARLEKLERHDSNFHLYELVHWAEGLLTGLNEDGEKVEPGKRSQADDGHCSSEVDFRGELKSAVSSLLDSYMQQEEQIDETLRPKGAKNPNKSEVFVMGDDDGDGVLLLGESFDGGLPELPTYQVLPPLAEALDQGTEEEKFEALDGLAKFEPGDLMASPQWRTVRSALQKALSDSSLSVVKRTLKFLVVLFESSHSSPQAVDLYLALCRHLQDSYTHPIWCEAYTVGDLDLRNSCSPNATSSVVENTSNSQPTQVNPEVTCSGHPAEGLHGLRDLLLRQYRLLNHFQLRIARGWLHFSAESMLQLTHQTVKLIVSIRVKCCK